MMMHSGPLPFELSARLFVTYPVKVMAVNLLHLKPFRLAPPLSFPRRLSVDNYMLSPRMTREVL